LGFRCSKGRHRRSGCGGCITNDSSKPLNIRMTARKPKNSMSKKLHQKVLGYADAANEDDQKKLAQRLPG